MRLHPPSGVRPHALTVPEYMAEQTERMGDSLAHFIETSPQEKLNWRPALEGSAPTRSILEQVSECVVVNRLIARLLSEGSPPKMPNPQSPALEFKDAQEAQQMVRESANALAKSVRAMSAEDLNRTFQHPRGAFLGRNLIMMCLRNMAYHAGQINYIQILAGDSEFHVPPKWR